MARPPDLAQGRRARELRVLELVGNAVVGGPERTVVQFVAARPAGVRAFAMLPFDGPIASALRDAGAPVHLAPVDDDAGLAESVVRAVEVVRRHAIDVIHAHLPNAHAVAALASSITGVPTLATVHGANVGMREWEVLTRRWSRAAFVCEAARAHALSLGAPAEQLACVTNGVDTAAYAPGPRSPLRRRWGVDDASPLVGFVGRLSSEKGPVAFLDACAAVAARRPDARFVVVGEGGLRGRCEALAARAPLAGRVTFAGLVHDMPEVYRALDIYVATSSTEGGPLAMLEAMACALPVVATAVGGVGEYATDRDSAMLVRPGDVAGLADRVAALLLDRPAAAALGARARERVVARHDLDGHVERLVAELARSARGGGAVERIDPARARTGS